MRLPADRLRQARSALWTHVWHTSVGTVVALVTGLAVAMFGASAVTADPSEGIDLPVRLFEVLETLEQAAQKYLDEG